VARKPSALAQPEAAPAPSVIEYLRFDIRYLHDGILLNRPDRDIPLITA